MTLHFVLRYSLAIAYNQFYFTLKLNVISLKIISLHMHTLSKKLMGKMKTAFGLQGSKMILVASGSSSHVYLDKLTPEIAHVLRKLKYETSDSRQRIFQIVIIYQNR